MPRRNFLLTLAYDGTDFAGWQRDPTEGGSRTAQREVELALGRLLGEEMEVTGASRTDAGVHAEGQAVSFHSRTALETPRIVEGLNGHLPPDLSCRSCREVDPRFHARFRAKGKLYRYRLHVGPVPDPFLRRWSLHVPERLDLKAMEAAAAALQGVHDFSAFTNAKGGSGHPGERTRRLDSVQVEARGEVVDLLFDGEGFLYNQVRIMAAALLEAGRGRLEAAAIKAALEGGKRAAMPGALGPYGLCLMTVHY
jgi:tRNA pseudouridine38-40 synthase